MTDTDPINLYSGSILSGDDFGNRATDGLNLAGRKNLAKKQNPISDIAISDINIGRLIIALAMLWVSGGINASIACSASLLTSIPCLTVSPDASSTASSSDSNGSVDRSMEAKMDPSVVVVLGIENQIRLGRWQPLRVSVDQTITLERFEITVPDGDGVPIVYQGSLIPTANRDGKNHYQGYFRLGRDNGEYALQLFDTGGTLVDDRRGRLKQLSIFPATRPFVLVADADKTVFRNLQETSIGQREELTKVSVHIEDLAANFPAEWFYWDGVKTVFLNPARVAGLADMSAPQWQALNLWVQQGGQLILSISPEMVDQLQDSPNLAPLVDLVGISEIVSGRLKTIERLAAYAGVKESVAELPVTDLRSAAAGRVIVEQDGLPLVIRRGSGMGEIVLVAFDWNHQSLVGWPGMKNFVYRLQNHLPIQEAAQSQRAQARSNTVSHPGYEDLSGQLRVALDRFQNVQFLSFTSIAILIALYILCVGPGDYFFLSRVTGKMELTWITFPLITLFFCGLAILIAQRSRPNQVQLNCLEIVDIDPELGLVRGNYWANLYSPNSGEWSVRLAAENSLGLPIESDLLGWQGLPGTGYGGMRSQTLAGVSQVAYRHQRNEFGSSDHQRRSELSGLPMSVSSTKSLFANYTSTFSQNFRSNLRLRSRAARLEGTVANPFDFPLKKVRLFFEGYVYILDDDFQAGETISIESEMRERTIASFLTRSRAVGVEDTTRFQISAWSETENRIPRIADIMMFHTTVGGSQYTSGLSHAYQDFTDTSRQLDLGRAILVAEVDRPATKLLIDDGATEIEVDQSVTIVRVVLPVAILERNR